MNHHLITLAITGAALTLLMGCSSAEPSADEMPTEERLHGDETTGIDAKELAENPCGTPRWDKPPPAVEPLDEEDESRDE